MKDHGMNIKSLLPKTADLLPAQENEKNLDGYGDKKYRSMIGSLFYLAVRRRPNISFSMAALTSQVHASSRPYLPKSRFGKADYLFCPLSCPVLHLSLRASIDADWERCKETRKSSSGRVIATNNAPTE